jgi:hypothetical protein
MCGWRAALGGMPVASGMSGGPGLGYGSSGFPGTSKPPSSGAYKGGLGFDTRSSHDGAAIALCPAVQRSMHRRPVWRRRESLLGTERHLSAHRSKARTSSEGRGQRSSDVSPVFTMSTMVWSETLSPGHPASQAPRELTSSRPSARGQWPGLCSADELRRGALCLGVGEVVAAA